MLCPVCKTPLTMSERKGIEIDYCQSCRGVWLDRGELDKIIERAAAAQAPAAASPPPQAGPWTGQPQGHYPQPQGHYQQPHGYKHHKRRKSFLEELFD
jgi:uncharacterized protein